MPIFCFHIDTEPGVFPAIVNRQHSLDKLLNLITSMEFGISQNFRRRVQSFSEGMKMTASVVLMVQWDGFGNE